jgi:hypothetical protein
MESEHCTSTARCKVLRRGVTRHRCLPRAFVRLAAVDIAQVEATARLVAVVGAVVGGGGAAAAAGAESNGGIGPKAACPT